MNRKITAFLLACFVACFGLMSLVLYELHVINNPRMPKIPGASAEEQKSPAVIAGYEKGLQVKNLVAVFWGVSWNSAAMDINDGASWNDAYSRWSHEGQPKRDDPIRDIVQRDLSRFMPTDRKPTKQESRQGYLYLSALAVAFPASR